MHGKMERTGEEVIQACSNPVPPYCQTTALPCLRHKLLRRCSHDGITIISGLEKVIDSMEWSKMEMNTSTVCCQIYRKR
jgi:hypothetical protein